MLTVLIADLISGVKAHGIMVLVLLSKQCVCPLTGYKYLDKLLKHLCQFHLTAPPILHGTLLRIQDHARVKYLVQYRVHRKHGVNVNEEENKSSK